MVCVFFWDKVLSFGQIFKKTCLLPKETGPPENTAVYKDEVKEKMMQLMTAGVYNERFDEIGRWNCLSKRRIEGFHEIGSILQKDELKVKYSLGSTRELHLSTLTSSSFVPNFTSLKPKERKIIVSSFLLLILS